MHRLIVLADLVYGDLYPAALAMLDGSYWDDRYQQAPPDFADRGQFEVGGGD